MHSSRFEFATVPQVLFGRGTLQETGRQAKAWGRRALLVTGRSQDRAAQLIPLLAEARISHQSVMVCGEPTVDEVVAAAGEGRRYGADMVIAIGGGSVIDAGKAIAGLLTNEDPVLDYLEVVGKGLPLELPAAPWVAIPTTAGTGAEVTRNAVLTVAEPRLKVSLRSNHLFASLAVVDPELTLGLPPAVTASTGLDALAQLIEAYVCTRANPMTDALCRQGIPRAAQALPAAFGEPSNLAARSELSLAALWSGMALTNAGLGAVHGFASPLGAELGAAHGRLCGALLGPVMLANVQALRASASGLVTLSRYAEIAAWVTGRPRAEPEEGGHWALQLARSLGVPGLAAQGLTESRFDALCERAARASSMKANPVSLSGDQLRACLAQAL